MAAHLSELDLKSLVSLAHIRKATQGVVAVENCHPFHRQWLGQDWVFAHNGDIRTDIPGAIVTARSATPTAKPPSAGCSTS